MTAKLTNLKIVHLLGGTIYGGKSKSDIDRARYQPPEIIFSNHSCEVYGLGILLWEIAEARIPYEKHDHPEEIIDLVVKKRYREPFSENSEMPEEFKTLALKGM